MFETTTKLRQLYYDLFSNGCVGLDTTKSRWKQPALQKLCDETKRLCLDLGLGSYQVINPLPGNKT